VSFDSDPLGKSCFCYFRFFDCHICSIRLLGILEAKDMKIILNSRLTLPIVWLFFFVLTHWPKEKIPDTPFIPHIDKVVHFTMYAILSFLFCHRITSIMIQPLMKFAFVFLVLALYGIFDELTQPYFDRTAEFLDWIADLCGVVFGIFIYRRIFSICSRNHK